MLDPQIIAAPQRLLVGKMLVSSMQNYRAVELWSSFMPLRNRIAHSVGEELFSVRVYKSLEYFTHYNPAATFDHWACREVSQVEQVQDGMQALTIPEGKYAVFLFKGTPADAPAFYAEVFQQWLPQSGFRLDARPHFEVMGAKYKHNDPDSEEEIWIPVS